MKITWFGHSAFRLDFSDKVVLLDPFFTGNPAFEGTVEKASAGVTHILITHAHGDHVGDSVALAKETGAQAFFPAGVHQLRDVYDAIAAELESQYSLAYSPTNRRVDGRFRRIIVRVTADPGFRSRARTGYTAESN